MASSLNRKEQAIADQIRALLAQLPPDGVTRVLADVEEHLDAEAHDGPVFARGRPHGPMGKLDTPVKTWLDGGTAELFNRKAAMRQQEASAALRDCAYAWVHGKTYTLMAAEKALHDADAMDIREQMAVPFAGREIGGR